MMKCVPAAHKNIQAKEQNKAKLKCHCYVVVFLRMGNIVRKAVNRIKKVVICLNLKLFEKQIKNMNCDGNH